MAVPAALPTRQLPRLRGGIARAALAASVLVAALVPVATAHADCIGPSAAWSLDGPMRGSSRACLGCHDGTVGPAVPTGPGSSFDHGEAHPVQTSYIYSMLKRRTPLRGTGELDTRIRLPEGKVECISCHNAEVKEGAHLAMSNENSSLCMQCHAM